MDMDAWEKRMRGYAESMRRSARVMREIAEKMLSSNSG
jgi:hypothetical protein